MDKRVANLLSLVTLDCLEQVLSPGIAASGKIRRLRSFSMKHVPSLQVTIYLVFNISGGLLGAPEGTWSSFKASMTPMMAGKGILVAFSNFKHELEFFRISRPNQSFHHRSKPSRSAHMSVSWSRAGFTHQSSERSSRNTISVFVLWEWCITHSRTPTPRLQPIPATALYGP